MLKVLKTELQFRNVPRAIALLLRIEATLAGDAPLTPSAQECLFLADPKCPPTPLVRPESSPPPQSTQPSAVILPKSAPKTIEKPVEPSVMPLDEACKVLNVTLGIPWEQVEQARAKIVQRSHPDALEGLSPDKCSAARIEAKRANAAYIALANGRRPLIS
jgi:hypothetical protein